MKANYKTILIGAICFLLVTTAFAQDPKHNEETSSDAKSSQRTTVSSSGQAAVLFWAPFDDSLSFRKTQKFIPDLFCDQPDTTGLPYFKVENFRAVDSHVPFRISEEKEDEKGTSYEAKFDAMLASQEKVAEPVVTLGFHGHGLDGMICRQFRENFLMSEYVEMVFEKIRDFVIRTKKNPRVVFLVGACHSGSIIDEIKKAIEIDPLFGTGYSNGEGRHKYKVDVYTSAPSDKSSYGTKEGGVMWTTLQKQRNLDPKYAVDIDPQQNHFKIFCGLDGINSHKVWSSWQPYPKDDTPLTPEDLEKYIADKTVFEHEAITALGKLGEKGVPALERIVTSAASSPESKKLALRSMFFESSEAGFNALKRIYEKGSKEQRVLIMNYVSSKYYNQPGFIDFYLRGMTDSDKDINDVVDDGYYAFLQAVRRNPDIKFNYKDLYEASKKSHSKLLLIFLLRNIAELTLEEQQDLFLRGLKTQSPWIVETVVKKMEEAFEKGENPFNKEIVKELVRLAHYSKERKDDNYLTVSGIMHDYKSELNAFIDAELELLKSKDPEEKAAGLQSSSYFKGDPRIRNTIFGMLEAEKDPDAKRELVDPLIFSYPRDEMGEPLVELLQHEDPGVRAAAKFRLQWSRPPGKAARAFIDAIEKDEDGEYVGDFVEGLLRTTLWSDEDEPPTPEDVKKAEKVFKKVLSNTENAEAKIWSIKALASLDPKAVEKHIEKLIDSPDEEEITAGVRMLLDEDSKTLEEDLERLLNSPSPSVRKAAVLECKFRNEALIAPHLKRMLEDEATDIRVAAADVLQSVVIEDRSSAKEEWLDPLFALSSDSRLSREEKLDALMSFEMVAREIGRKEDFKRDIMWAYYQKAENPEQKRGFIRRMTARNHSRVDNMLEAAEDSDDDVRAEAMYSLGVAHLDSGDLDKVMEGIKKGLSDPNYPKTQAAAFEALGNLRVGFNLFSDGNAPGSEVIDTLMEFIDTEGARKNPELQKKAIDQIVTAVGMASPRERMWKDLNKPQGRALPLLVKVMETGNDSSVVEAAAVGASRLSHNFFVLKPIEDLVRKDIGVGEPVISEAAAGLLVSRLGNFNSPKYHPLLKSVLFNHRSPEVQKAAARGFIYYDDPEVSLPIVLHRLQRADRDLAQSICDDLKMAAADYKFEQGKFREIIEPKLGRYDSETQAALKSIWETTEPAN